MKNRRNYYRILKVQPDAPTEIIRASYRASMRELKSHPDLGGSTDDAALLNEAYEVLSDPRRRASYDENQRIGFSRGMKPLALTGSSIESVCPFCRTSHQGKPVPGEFCATCESPLASMSTVEHDEASRRSVARMKKDDKLRYYTRWPQKGREARFADLSPKGMRFVCAEGIATGAVIKISAPLLEATAAVTNVRGVAISGKEMFSIGVSFLAVKFDHSKGTFVSTLV